MQQFHHKTPIKPEDQPCQHIPPKYGLRKQYTEPVNMTPKMDRSDKIFVQKGTRIFIYDAMAVDSIMFVALSSIASEHSNTIKQERKSKKGLKLCGITPIYNIHIPCKWHDIGMPQGKIWAGGDLLLSEND